MNAKKLVKEYEKQLEKDPGNLVLRLKLAAALRELGRTADAVAMYHSVARAYYQQGRLAQGIAVCRSVLEIEPSHSDTQALLAILDSARAAQIAAAPPEPMPPPPVAPGRTPGLGVPTQIMPPSGSRPAFSTPEAM